MANRKYSGVYRRDGYRCVICGSKRELTIDHIVPKMFGGTNKRKNLRVLCRLCHIEVDRHIFAKVPVKEARMRLMRELEAHVNWPHLE